MTPLRLLPWAAMAAVAAATVATSSCQSDERNYVRNVGDGESTPTMLTESVRTFISDSGYTRYFIKTERWEMYDEAKDPFWFFPTGLEFEQYDRDLAVIATMRCDSAKYWSQKRLWRLDGNVVMVNTETDSFLTHQVFWDQLDRKVYSDSFIHIVRSDRIIEGFGFTSNEPMTEYTVNRPTGIFPVSEHSLRSDTTPPDRAQKRSPAPSASSASSNNAPEIPRPENQ